MARPMVLGALVDVFNFVLDDRVTNISLKKTHETTGDTFNFFSFLSDKRR